VACEYTDCIHLLYERVQLWVLVNMIMNLTGILKVGNFLSSWPILASSERLRSNELFTYNFTHSSV
jgi:hypothetical protein